VGTLKDEIYQTNPHEEFRENIYLEFSCISRKLQHVTQIVFSDEISVYVETSHYS
jgi:hypothetical protein